MKRIVPILSAMLIVLFLISCTEETSGYPSDTTLVTTASENADSSATIDETNAQTTTGAVITSSLTTTGPISTLVPITTNTTDTELSTTGSIENVSVVFDAQGGSIVETKTGEPGEILSEPTPPTREGYIFAGWYEAIEDLEAFEFSVIPSSDITLYADWATDGLTYTLFDEWQAYAVSGSEIADLELEAIAIPKRHQGLPVKTIDASGFYEFEYLTEVRIPAGVESIGNSAFNGCDDLQTVYLPDSLVSIGNRAFMLCPSLTTIEVDGNNQYFTVVDNVLFDKDLTTLIQYPAGSTSTSYEIGSAVRRIGDGAFAGCYFLESVTIGENVETIGEWAFYWSVNIESIIIPNSVTSVGIYAFSDCYGLESVSIGTGIDTISAYMFSWCNNLDNVIIPANITTIGYSAFDNCHELKNVYIERSYSPGNSIFGASFMFNNTHSLLSIYMPDTDSVDFYKNEATGGWTSYRSRIKLAP